MKKEKLTKCRVIIHSHAAAAATANAVPVPGLGLAADVTAMTTMAMGLASVFGGDIPKAVARNLAINTIRRTVLKQPIKTLAKELSRLVPGLGQIVAPTVSAAMLESAGWSMAKEMELKYSNINN